MDIHSFLSMRTPPTLYPPLPCSICHALQVWQHSLVRAIIDAREFANVGVIAINILNVFPMTPKPCGIFIYDEFLQDQRCPLKSFMALTMFLVAKNGIILIGVLLLSISDNTS